MGGDSVWVEVCRSAQALSPRPALFLDRDGTIVEEVGYLWRPEDVRLIAGAADVIATANRSGLPVVMVSNQSGVGRGLFDWDDFAAVQQRIVKLLAAEGASVDAVLACPHHAEAEPPYRHPDHPWRKPNAGMLLAAAGVLPVKLAASWIIGDRASDLAAGRSAGLAGGLLVATGCGSQSRERAATEALSTNTFRVRIGSTIAASRSLLPILEGGRSTEFSATGGTRSAHARP
jgi:D-glycero-D-manno-heptose 1,7-bisphosphate phosphatase